MHSPGTRKITCNEVQYILHLHTKNGNLRFCLGTKTLSHTFISTQRSGPVYLFITLAGMLMFVYGHYYNVKYNVVSPCN